MGRIVVGIDGSSESEDALEFALAEARLRGTTLHVVHAWRTPLTLALPEPTVMGYAPVSAGDLEQLAAKLRERAEQLVAEELHAVLGDDPRVEVRREVLESDAAEALVEASRGADLLVVGSRGRGGFSGLLLGSVGQHVAHHAHCPVVIVPNERPAVGTR